MTADNWVALGTWALVFVSGIAVWRQIAANNKAARQTLFVQLAHEYQEPGMRRLRQNSARALLAYHRDVRVAVRPLGDETVFEFLENVSFLCRQNHLDIDLVWSSFSETICGYWSGAKDAIAQLRRDSGDHLLYCEVESLNHELLEIDAKRRNKTVAEVAWHPVRTQRFLESETNLE